MKDAGTDRLSRHEVAVFCFCKGCVMFRLGLIGDPFPGGIYEIWKEGIPMIVSFLTSLLSSVLGIIGL